MDSVAASCGQARSRAGLGQVAASSPVSGLPMSSAVVNCYPDVYPHSQHAPADACTASKTSPAMIKSLVVELDSVFERVFDQLLAPTQSARFFLAAKQLADSVHIPDFQLRFTDDEDAAPSVVAETCSITVDYGASSEPREMSCNDDLVGQLAARQKPYVRADGSVLHCSVCPFPISIGEHRDDMHFTCECGGIICFTCQEKGRACRCGGAGGLFRTQLCRLFASGSCARARCSFAHGEAELRPRPSRYLNIAASQRAGTHLTPVGGNGYRVPWADQVQNQNSSADDDADPFANCSGDDW